MNRELTLARHQSLVVVGASLAGLRAVEAARQEGFEGKIVLIGDEPHLPYDRPPLSKAFLEGRVSETTHRDLPTLVDQLGIDLRLGSTATRLDVGHKEITTTSATIGYDRLIIATGSCARTIDSSAQVSGVHVLRTKDDAAAIRDAVAPGSRVVVLGGGFIGAEVASACHKLGADVSIIEAADVPLVRAVGAQLGATLAQLHGRHGVSLRTGVAVQEVLGHPDVRAVRLTDGTDMPADLVVVGIGAMPATSWLRGSGVRLHPRDGGVVCDEHLATSVPDVWAAGDVAHWPNLTLGVTARLENWTNAAQQGAHAARNALRRQPSPFGTVPYYWSDWYGHRIQFVGVPDADEVRCSGSLEAGRLIAVYRKGTRLAGALAVNEPGRIMKLRAMIAAQTPWSDALAFARRSAATSTASGRRAEVPLPP